MKLKSVAILLIILLSLLPIYFLFKYLQKIIRPKETIQRFLLYMISVFALIFIYTFLTVFLLKMVFPRA